VFLRTKEQNEKRNKLLDNIRDALRSPKIIDDDDIEKFIEEINESTSMGFSTSIHMFPDSVYQKYKQVYNDNHKDEDSAKEAFSVFYFKYLGVLDKIDFKELCKLRCNYDNYLDSEPVEFDGDIIITDPCYIIRDEDMTDNDWQESEYGERLDKLGIKHFMSRDTLFGDWSCSVFNTNTNRKIGSFCADAGMVSVLLLDDVLKYNPSFNYHTEKKWTTALIKDFKGTVQFIVREVKWFLDEDTSYGKKGDEFTDYAVEVVGHGINKKTGKPIDFIGRQTGL
jgi:hypothetical protein